MRSTTPPTRFPALHAAHPLAQWAHADRSRDRPCPHPFLLCPPCARRLSLLRGDSHYGDAIRGYYTPILCVRGPCYEYNGRGYAVLPGVDIRCHIMPVSVFTVNKELQ